MEDNNLNNNNTESTQSAKETNKKLNKKEKKLIIIFSIIFTIIFTSFSLFILLSYQNYMSRTISHKPIIYLYPTSEQTVSVKLGYPDKLTHTYPKYEDSWEVVAKPNGDLTDLKTGKGLYSLYWEGINSSAKSNISEGFCVKGEDTAAFLEEKLAILGLNERESEEFIIYWLPKLESNKYNLIRFETMEEINNNMPLDISPTPDTLIRVLMEFKGVDSYVEIPEQKLDSPARTGFVAVEWGGTEIK